MWGIALGWEAEWRKQDAERAHPLDLFLWMQHKTLNYKQKVRHSECNMSDSLLYCLTAALEAAFCARVKLLTRCILSGRAISLAVVVIYKNLSD
jgi:hypothetical protein